MFEVLRVMLVDFVFDRGFFRSSKKIQGSKRTRRKLREQIGKKEAYDDLNRLRVSQKDETLKGRIIL